MSEVLAQLEKKGGNPKETTLWTNPNPSASFSAQNISLSDDCGNYDYLRVYYKPIYNSAADLVYYTDFPKDTFINASLASYKPCIVICARYSNNEAYARALIYQSATSFLISDGYILSGSSTATSSYMTVPTKVCGIKY